MVSKKLAANLGGRAENELNREDGGDARGGVQQSGKMAGNLTAAAAGEERDHGTVCRDALRREKGGAAVARGDVAGQGMADKPRGHAAVAKPFFFKRKDAKQFSQIAPHLPDAALTPGPGLWGHQVNHGDTLLAQAAGHAEVEVGGIGKDGQIGLLAPGRRQQFFELTVDARQVCDDFHQADHAEFFGVDHGTDPGGQHPRLRAAEEIEIGAAPAQGFDQARGIKVATGFARRDQNTPRHSLSAYRAIMRVLMTERLTVKAFAERFRQEMVPLSGKISFYSAGLRLNEEDEKELIYDPIGSLPPMVRELLPDMAIVLVPHLEGTGEVTVVMDPPKNLTQPDVTDRVWLSETKVDGRDVLTFAVQGCDSGEYHYRLFRTIAARVVERAEKGFFSGFEEILRDELRRHVHGEMDEASWRAKEALLAASKTPWRESKAFRGYAREATIDSLTLYLHGLCCDIDVEPGPRQMKSREMKRRLSWLWEHISAPEGYTVFPEQRKSQG
jgi:hypothetical protein